MPSRPSSHLQPDFKSAPIPDEDDATENSVTVVVGKTVESIVFDETKDVLLEIYGAGGLGFVCDVCILLCGVCPVWTLFCVGSVMYGLCSF